MKKNSLSFSLRLALLLFAPLVAIGGGGPPISDDKDDDSSGREEESVGSPEREPAASNGLTPAERIYNEGWAHMQEGEWENAEARFVLALGLDEKFPQAHSNLAYVLRRQGEENYAKALRHYNRALELDPQLGIALEYRGELFVQMGEWDKARADLAELQQLDPTLAADLEAVMENEGSWPDGGGKSLAEPIAD